MMVRLHLNKHYTQTYCERGKGHAHAPKAVECQGDEDEDREFCKGHEC